MPLLALFLSWTLLLSSHLAIAKPADTDENAANSAGNAGNPNTRVYNTFSSNGGQGGGGRSGGFGMDPYLGDFDEEWAKMSGRVQSQKCVDIPSNLTLCKDIGYDRMMLPNLLQHDTLSEVTQQARSWVPLVGVHCHPDTQVFLCSLFSPVCLDRSIYPCRTLCESVRNNCLHRMTRYGFDWPAMLQCDKFPEDNDLCIKLIHDIKPDNNCTACKHPMTYEAIIDNYCRAEFVSKVKIQRTEERGADRALILKKGKRYYKKENITKQERVGMEPLIRDGDACACDVINDTSKHFLVMGGHKQGQLMVDYVVEFKASDKDFRKALKDIRKANVCRSIIHELASGDLEKPTGDKDDDGRCLACKLPMSSATIVEKYCLADFALRVSVTGLEQRDGHQALLMKKRRKNYKKGVITKKEEKAMVPLLDGKEDCTCDLVANKKTKYFILGSKQADKYVVNYVTEFANKDKEFKRALKAIRKGDACQNIPRGTGLGGVESPGSSSTSRKGRGKGKGGKGKNRGKKRKKGGKKGGKKGKKKGRKGKKGKKNKKNSAAENNNAASGKK